MEISPYKINVLVLGSGAREHAIGWKIKQSDKLNKLYFVPGNGGTKDLGTNINSEINDFESIKKICLKFKINMLIVGPEGPLVNGICDFFKNDLSLKNIIFIGPNKLSSKLEGSKDFAKKFLIKNNIPTAKYKSFNESEIEEAKLFLDSISPPYVIKADGLAGGKGVLIFDDITKAKFEINEMLLNKKFGDSSKKVIIEEFLDGIELSVFLILDGDNYIILPSAKDYKKIGEGDSGLNTGGMGAISPVPFLKKSFLKKIKNKIILPTIAGLKKEKINYSGFLFIGLMKFNEEPYVIEYNVRLGDPETQVILPRINSDFLDLLIHINDKNLNNYQIKIDERFASTIFLVSGGYPKKYEINKLIENTNKISDSILFHGGTKSKNGSLYTTGGRVISVTSINKTMNDAIKISSKNSEIIKFEKKYYRRDIGFDL